VLVLDLWARAPVRAVSVTPPPEYVWLRAHPGGIVADYPLKPGDYPHYQPQLRALQDGHPLFQGYGAGTDSESRKLDLADLAAPGTAAGLASLQVRYIVVHPGQPGDAPAQLSRRGFALRFASSDGDVWQVVAAPAATTVAALSQFDVPQGTPGSMHRWMLGTGTLAVSARGCGTCGGTVTFTATSNVVGRVLTVSELPSGRVLARVQVPSGRYVAVAVPGVSLARGRALLSLSTDVPPSPLPGGASGWPRSVAIAHAALRLTGG
jgi:hypothetical protein